MFFEEEEEGKESFVAGTVLRNATAKDLCKVSFREQNVTELHIE